jgi:hypothetical protein
MTSAEMEEAVRIAREHLDDLHPMFLGEDQTKLARCVLALSERCERLERIAEVVNLIRCHPVPIEEYLALICAADAYWEWNASTRTTKDGE